MSPAGTLSPGEVNPEPLFLSVVSDVSLTHIQPIQPALPPPPEAPNKWPISYAALFAASNVEGPVKLELKVFCNSVFQAPPAPVVASEYGSVGAAVATPSACPSLGTAAARPVRASLADCCARSALGRAAGPRTP